MDKEILEIRIKEISTAMEQALANYHSLAGRLSEIKYILEQQNSTETKKSDSV